MSRKSTAKSDMNTAKGILSGSGGKRVDGGRAPVPSGKSQRRKPC